MRETFILRLTTAAVLLGSAAPAMAKWQYTDWTMTPEQVVAKSRGQAKERADIEDDRVSGLHELVDGVFQDNGNSYDISFLFNPQTRKLSKVALLPLMPAGQEANMGAKCDAMIRMAEKAYGPVQVRQEQLDLGDYKLPMFVRDWTARDDKGAITLVDVIEESAGLRMCKLLISSP